MPAATAKTGKAERTSDLQDLKDPGYELFIIGVSVLSVINLVLVYIPGLDPDAVNVILVFNFFLTIIFIADFLFRLFSAQSKTHYFFRDWGWADLLASIPSLRILRVFRIFKAYRLMSRYGAKNIWEQLNKHRAESMLYVVLFSVMLVIESGSVLVLMAERFAPNANIQTASDAMWWVYVTITTVGYGDRYPVTNAGRIVGVLVMTTGVGLFGTLAGYIANKLLAPDVDDTAAAPDDGKKAGAVPAGERGEEILARLDRIEAELKNRPR